MSASVFEHQPVRSVMDTPRPEYLWHYTGPAGVIGICQSRSLLAGRAADMNDITEQRLARDLVSELLEVHLSKEPDLKPFVDGYRARCLDDATQARTYTISLTSEEDSLEQWRAYCPRSGGVAIGLDSDALHEAALSQGFILAPCVYDAGGHWEICQSIVDAGVERARGIKSQEDLDRATYHLDEAVEQVAPLLKHESFRLEHEWRLITHPLVYDVDRERLFYLPTDSGLREFIQLSLDVPEMHSSRSNPGMGTVRFKVGPNRDREAMRGALWQLGFKVLALGSIGPIEYTEHPYR